MPSLQIKADSEKVYAHFDYESLVVRTVPKNAGGFQAFGKFYNQKKAEFEFDRTNADQNLLLADALRFGKEITEKTYLSK